jgi:Holliday junction DNA helicase RuvA
MYDFFIGKVAARTPTSLVLDVGGVGYRFEVPISTSEKVGERTREAPSGTVRILAHLHVREDALKLYGFATEAERRLFEHLIGIKGIGPQTALTILSGASVSEFVRAIKGGDARSLERIKGIGKKTAERVLLELREKADLLLAGTEAEPPHVSGPAEDAVRALMSLGYGPAIARKAVDAAVEAQGGPARNGAVLRVEDLVKEALRHAS